MDIPGIVKIALGLIVLAVLPGWVWSRALLPELGGLERFVTSVALSVALLTLALYVGSVLGGVPVGAATAIGWAVGLTLLGWAVTLRPRGSRPPNEGGAGTSPSQDRRA